MTNCYFCNSEMIWGGDFTREDYGMEGEGLVVNLSCPNCQAYAEFTQEDQITDNNNEYKGLIKCGM